MNRFSATDGPPAKIQRLLEHGKEGQRLKPRLEAIQAENVRMRFPPCRVSDKEWGERMNLLAENEDERENPRIRDYNATAAEWGPAQYMCYPFTGAHGAGTTTGREATDRRNAHPDYSNWCDDNVPAQKLYKEMMNEVPPGDCSQQLIRNFTQGDVSWGADHLTGTQQVLLRWGCSRAEAHPPSSMVVTGPPGSGKSIGTMFPVCSALDRVGKANLVGARKDHIYNDGPARPHVLFLVPTTNFAHDCYRMARKFLFDIDATVLLVIGGEKRDEELVRQTACGADVLIATPGKLISFLNEGIVCLDSVSLLVLDGAEQLVSESDFPEQVREIVDHHALPRNPNAVQFVCSGVQNSPQVVDMIAGWMMKQNNASRSPTRLSLLQYKFGTGSDACVAEAGRVRHIAMPIKATTDATVVKELKKKALLDLLDAERSRDPKFRAIIFCNTVSTVEELFKDAFPQDNSWSRYHRKVTCLTRNVDNKTQQNAKTELNRGNINVLIASDIVKFGVDFNSVGLVVHYDLCRDVAHFEDRCGRGGRNGNGGGSSRQDASEARSVALVAYRAGPSNASVLVDGAALQVLRHLVKKLKEQDGGQVDAKLEEMANCGNGMLGCVGGGA